MNDLVCDKTRYLGKMPRFQYYYRKCQESTGILLTIYRALFSRSKRKNHIDLYYKTDIGGGLYIGHPYCITIVTIQYPFKVHFLFDFNYLSTVILTKRSKSVIRFFPVLC